ncbi:hypothetical protein KQH60_05665 [Mycetohabitans sp. B8]|uniref:hypothetical protein n=1 Tax=Mycetohabitans sp. B8 TaxID=2841845 RepID=UPI001F397166|nr:hypothetical protein [Mycetohabitans sp. B8]MCG1042072.1 hypothetical protein [Mycetohabitans sp. B8]
MITSQTTIRVALLSVTIGFSTPQARIPWGRAFLAFAPRDEACVGAQIDYRGRVLDHAQPRAPVRIVPLAAIPWNELRNDAVVLRLERYVIERSEDLLSANSGTPQPPHAAS